MGDTIQKLVLVTGGAGFVGSHLCERLVADGHRVISLDNYFTGSKDNHVSGVEYRVGHTKDIARSIPETPDLIYHLGEYARVEQSVLEPDIVEDLNTVGTAAVIEFWKRTKCKLVYAGSSTKFGDGGNTRHTSPYARTKAENTERVKAVGQESGLPYAITYFYNVYGPRERSGVYGTVIEHFKHMYRSGAPCAVVSPGTQARNFTHVADIVDGIVAAGEQGQGDEYGLGNERAYTILELAALFGFGGNIVMFPPRPGNRMASTLDTTKARSLGWQATRSLEAYVRAFTAETPRGQVHEKRVLVFSTTMHPVAGLAEEALVELARALPDVQFDVVTTRFTAEAANVSAPVANITLHRIGIGAPIDKFFLPFLGVFAGWSLIRKHRYLFTWSIMASYAALAALMLKWLVQTPLLITLADQNLDDLSPVHRAVFRLLLSRADQVYGTHGVQEAHAARMSGAKLPRTSLGEGDAFANALRYAYADVVRRELETTVRKRKVLIFSLAYYPHVGGAEVAIKEITDRLSDIEFHMVTLRFSRAEPAEAQIGNVTVHRIWCGPGRIGKALFQFDAALKATFLHRRHRFNAVWAMMAHSTGVPTALFKAFHPEVPYILNLQEGDPPEYIERLMRPFGPLFRRAFTTADVVQPLSTYLADWARRMGATCPIVIIPNGVDIHRFEGEPVVHKGTVLITTSRLVHKNGVDTVIRALPLLPDVRFQILGTGPDERMLRKLAAELGVADRVEFVGHVDHAAMPAYLHRADIFVRPSRSEGQGASFMETMGAGLPIIGSDVGGIPDFLSPKTGWVVKPDAPEQVAEAVTDILAHPDKAAAITRTAKALVLEKYDWDTIAKDMHEKVFARLLQF